MGWIRWAWFLGLICFGAWALGEEGVVDSGSLTGKVMCGYQGWFNAPGDGAGRGWVHWGRGKMEGGSATVDLWPDVSELDADERFATGFKMADGRAAEVFSSYSPKTVARHFLWMKQYGIDGVFLQRFANGIGDERVMKHYARVVENVRAGAKTHGRVWGMMYDLTGVRTGQISKVMEDWKRLVDEEKVLEGGRYIRHGGKPVVAVWGIGFSDDGRDPLMGDGLKLIRFLKEDGKYGGNMVMLGLPRGWRTMKGGGVTHEQMMEVALAGDIVSPWAVGGTTTPAMAADNARKFWAPDLAWCKENKKEYMPVVFPGFSWHNLRDGKAKLNQIPRLGGRFLWSQFVEAKKAGATMVYQAMFDEVDEGTAIFKCVNETPVGAGGNVFLGYEGVASDFYLKMVGRGGRLIRGEIGEGDVEFGGEGR